MPASIFIQVINMESSKNPEPPKEKSVLNGFDTLSNFFPNVNLATIVPDAALFLLLAVNTAREILHTFPILTPEVIEKSLRFYQLHAPMLSHFMEHYFVKYFFH